MKKCSKCKIEKPKTDFYKRKQSKDGLKPICKECFNKYINERRAKQTCVKCNKKCLAKNGLCQSCKNLKAQEEYEKLTLGEKIYSNHKYAKYSYIRYWARRKAIDLGWDRCIKCGYDKHFEVAHIKPISEFSPETTLVEINHESNLMPLCPNCHWEFDNLS